MKVKGEKKPAQEEKMKEKKASGKKGSAHQKQKSPESSESVNSKDMPDESTKRQHITGYNELEEQQRVGGDFNLEQLW